MGNKMVNKNVRKPGGLVASVITKLGRAVIRHLSDLARESLKDPGSWRCLEIVYRNAPQTLLDRFFLSSRSARGARNRLQVLQEEICKCIQWHSQISNPVKVISFGSGPGHEVLGSLERLWGHIEVKATCVDKETNALEQGRFLTAQKELSDYVEFVQGNVLRMNPVSSKYDIGILSGLIDYFEFETAVLVLNAVRKQLLPGGTVFVANMRHHYLASTMSILGNWNLVYREPQDVERILADSGYEEIQVWLEPEKVFCIGRGRKPE